MGFHIGPGCGRSGARFESIGNANVASFGSSQAASVGGSNDFTQCLEDDLLFTTHFFRHRNDNTVSTNGTRES